ncbi:AarF/ABC1/UbiB kinase family protein [Nocardia yamanashiensis]|uniref:ABC1 kinase family protein n=1 Tax=Nocardia yamanashiensis TaxID=209247 RepID=UPI001E51DFE6|nr:AarF/ABC1/UbiB kinase family protein [Nocardia yamanashiensis]UGT44353.1 AarF/ABC1/UbiB kinase family protein [Nocardia yamanashiensis]
MPEPRQGGLRRLRRRSASENTGQPPTSPILRNAKMATLPVAYAARKAGGLGRRATGTSKAQVDLDIQARTAQHMFEVLGELKGCAAKFGQLLALYELALPPELGAPYREALSQLQDSAPAMLPAAVDQAMAAQLGPDWRELFADFDFRATAAASVGQVHRATWHDGRTVAVKLMYPGARESVRSDLAQIRRMAPLATIFMPGADVNSVAEAFVACIDDELDYTREAETQRVFADAFADDPDFVVPRVVHQQGDVVISEWLDGIPLSRVIATGAQAERDRVGMLVLRFVMSSFTRTGLIYTDTHPGNFRIMRDGRLGIVDYGACSPFPEHFPHLFAELADCLFNGTHAELDAALRRHGFLEADREFDIEAFVALLEPISALMFPRTVHLTTPWLREQVKRATSLRLSNVARQLTTPAEFTALGRTLLTTIGVLCQLNAEGAFRDELFVYCPELAGVYERFLLREGAATGASTSATAAPTLVSVPCTSRW